MRRLRSSLKAFIRAQWWRDQYLPVLLTPLIYQVSLGSQAVSGTWFAIYIVLFFGVTYAYGRSVHLIEHIADQMITFGRHPFVKGHRRVFAKRFLRLIGYLLIVCLLCTGLPRSPIAWGCMAAGYLAVLVYCLPPIRLKKRGLIGASTQGLYIYTFPCLAATFFGAAFKNTLPSLWWLILVVIWSYAYALRHIIGQQLDLVAIHQFYHISTAVTLRGWRWGFRFWATTIFYLEITSFFLLFFLFCVSNPLIIIGFLWHTSRILYWQRANSLIHKANIWLLPDINRSTITNKLILDGFLTTWVPLLLMVPLLKYGRDGSIPILVYCILFDNPLRTFVRDFLKASRNLLKQIWHICVTA